MNTILKFLKDHVWGTGGRLVMGVFVLALPEIASALNHPMSADTANWMLATGSGLTGVGISGKFLKYWPYVWPVLKSILDKKNGAQFLFFLSLSILVSACAGTPATVKKFMYETGGPRYESFCLQAKRNQLPSDKNDYEAWIDEYHAVIGDMEASE